MVRVGGGWEPLEEFLRKHDPCRGLHHTTHTHTHTHTFSAEVYSSKYIWGVPCGVINHLRIFV